MGITREKFDEIAKKYANIGSWAVWPEFGDTPRANIDDLTVLDPDKNKDLLDILKPNIVMIGLNISRELDKSEKFRNYHCGGANTNDFKLRYAFKDTDYWGAYMTDFIKNHVDKNSEEVLDYLANNPKVVEDNLNAFREEMKFIGANKPKIIAFGIASYNFLKKYLTKDDYSELVQVLHFSDYIGKEEYKEKVHEQLNIK